MNVIKKKLVIDILAYEQGKAYGYQQYVNNFLNYLWEKRDSIKFEMIIIACQESQVHLFQIYSDKFTVKGFRSDNIFIRMIIQTLLPINLRLKKDDLIISTSNYSGLIKNSKQLLVIHDLLFKRKKLFPYPLMRIQRQFYLPISIKHADKIIAISHSTKEDIEFYYPKGKYKIRVIYNYFNFKKFGNLNRNILLKENYFLSICSTAMHKNLITVLKAFENYCINGGIYNLVLVGTIPNKSDIVLYFDNLVDTVKQRIQIYSHISDEHLSKLYMKANAYISASLFEGLGMPIVEAMYFDLPLLLTDDKVFREVSLNKGYYFNPLDLYKLSNLMFKIQQQGLTRMDYSDDIQFLYSEQNTSHQYVTLINELW